MRGGMKPAGSGQAVADLLKPSLQATSPAIAIYSIRASFFVAFLGGPLAIVLFTALNSRLLNRLGRDAVWLAIGGIVALGAVVVSILLLDSARAVPDGWLTAQNVRIASRGLAFLLCGGYFLLHRTQHRSMQFLGIEPREPWVAGIACTALGTVVSVALAVFLAQGIKG